jgi:ABC-type transport system involved in cytochrome c biogenesis permease subunit
MITASIAFVILISAAVVQIVYLVSKRKRPDPFSHWLLMTAAALLFVTTVYRSMLIEFVALTNTFEALIFFSGVIAAVLAGYRIKAAGNSVQLILFGGTIIALILLAIAASPIASSEIAPPIPALQSHWLVLHVGFSFIGEAFFVVSFVAAILYLAYKDDLKKAHSDRIIYTSIAIGYPIFTAGALIFGAIWAEQAWGSFWSWDPKETWALITWLVYTAYLHTRFVRKLQGTFSAVLAIVGFGFTMFTFFGVNYLLPGLHSYV